MRYVNACECQQWHLMVWEPGDVSTTRRVPYRCRSWRHAGGCRLWKGAQDFARCKAAIDKRVDWVYIVLTFAQRNWPDPILQYRLGCQLWSKLRLRLRRMYGTFAYIQTWERHARGGSHVNVLIGNPYIYEQCKADSKTWITRILKPMAVACGFGYVTYAMPLREKTGDSMAGYLVKLARELTGAGTKDQVPIDAPPHFRRIRASNGLLPPPVKSGLTGRMVFAPIAPFLPRDAT